MNIASKNEALRAKARGFHSSFVRNPAPCIPRLKAGVLGRRDKSSRRLFRVGTRTSPLALIQAEEAIMALKDFYPEIEYKIVGIETYGDKDKIRPISEIEGTDFFTREIEEALLNNKIDFAVHSAKDMPDRMPKALVVAAITKSIDPHDALVSRNNLKIDELPAGAKIGVSSLRRKTQLKKYRPDFQVTDIRGSVNERLEKLDRTGPSELDAIIVAVCALMRLGLEARITQSIPFDILTPHKLQGSLAIETRDDRKELVDMLKVLDGKPRPFDIKLF